ncbi:hypothetical protein [Nocardiopsis sp. NRRL B-16309]|uniref:hypothetical protein n=1 Tax=Nocardiopsis sp. NRRL B-16309 TaxID=1519494 RepID=UPI0006B05172|nr:hypothetical protein [Nocardiopsis sp. NRRL B-16309]KOX22086.1 hypothetical protein ADL05_03400 [Nocardiopsis sp. NRRL B-16309]
MSRKGFSPAFALVLTVLAGTVAYVGLAGLDQGLRAARGEGAPGVFTATALTCVQHPGHESCGCDGTFTAADGGPAREVTLHGAGRDTCVVGTEIAAVDAGADTRVYGPDGSREWIFSAFLLAGASLAVLWSAFQGVLALLDRARHRSDSSPARESAHG